MTRQFLYVVLLRNGLIKIGRTTTPQTRIRALNNKIGPIEAAWCAECDWFSAMKLEQTFLKWAAGIGCLHRTAKELFEDLRIGAVLNRLKQISRNRSLIALKTTFRKFDRVAPLPVPVVVSWTNEFGTWHLKKPKLSKYS